MVSFVTRTVGDVVSEILMSRTAFDGSFLVLEGDSDSKFFSRRIAKGRCQIVIAGGKATVCGAVLRAHGAGERGVLGVTDDDYDSLCDVPIPSPHILRTDARDIEMVLLRSTALDAVLEELGDDSRIPMFQRDKRETVRDGLLRRSLLFGKLRLLSKRNGWNVDFQRLSPWRYADHENWVFDETALIEDVNRAVGLPLGTVKNLLSSLQDTDPYRILHGRDTVTILAIGLKSVLGKEQTPIDRICQMLRLAFDDAMAKASVLFQEIHTWEMQHPPYQIVL